VRKKLVISYRCLYTGGAPVLLQIKLLVSENFTNAALL
jgi:hypothetical protein